MKSHWLWCYHLLTRWLPESRAFGVKAVLLRLAGAKVGRNVRIYSSAKFTGVGELEFGDDVHIGPAVVIATARPAKINIGSCVDIGPGAMILSGSHEIDSVGEHIAGRGIAKPVTVGEGCWIGARSVILPGVELPRKTIVAAGAVVTKSVEVEQCLVAGVPATVRKRYV